MFSPKCTCCLMLLLAGMVLSSGSSAQEPKKIGKDVEPRRLSERFKIPDELPGAKSPPLQLPKDPKEREEAVHKLFPELPVMLADPTPGPDQPPLMLADLQQMALASNPLIRQAAADIEAARGAAIQAGLCPNPTIGYEGDTIGTGPRAGYQGGFIDQLIKTGGKLRLAREAGFMDMRNAELALLKAKADLASQVRGGYFNVLVARENLKIARALARLTEEAYRIQVDQLKAAQVAAYEPMQMRVLAMQARGTYIQARNRYVAAWKQLAATLALPGLPPAELVGQVDVPIPVYNFDAVLSWVLTRNTDVGTAENLVAKAKINLHLAKVTPIPDVDIRPMVQKDGTTPPFRVVPSVQLGFNLPIWDRNQGGIHQAEANLKRSLEEPHRVRDDLTSRLTEAFQRYEDNRILIGYYRDAILPDQVRAYRGAYERHGVEPDKVAFADVVNAQMNLAATITSYVQVLGALWTSVVDVSNLLQLDDLFLADGPCAQELIPSIPDLEHLPTLPCCHDPALTQFMGADGTWPPADASTELPQAEVETLPAPVKTKPE